MDSSVKQTMLIEVELDDNTASNLNTLKGNIKTVAGENEKATSSMTSSIIKSGIALKALGAAWNITKNFMSDVVNEGSSFTRLDTSLKVVMSNLGYTSEELDQMKSSLEDVNTWGSKADNVLLSLARTGLLQMVDGMKFANGKEGLEGLVLGFKDLSAVAGVSSGEGIQRLTKFIQTGNSSFADGIVEVGNLEAVYKSYASTLGKSTTDLTEQQRALARLNAIMNQATLATGAYDATNQTAAKNMLSIKDAASSLKEMMGSALEPIFQTVTSNILQDVKNMRSGVQSNFSSIVKGAAALANGIGFLINSGRNFVTSNKNLILGLGALVIALGVGIFTITQVIPAVAGAISALKAFTASLTFTKIAVGGLAGALSVALGVLGYMYIKDIKLNGSLSDMSNLFKNAGTIGTAANNAIADSGNSAADSIANIRKQIEQENASYQEQLGEIVKNARQRIAENTAEIAKEKADYDKLVDEKNKAYEEDKSNLEAQNKDKLDGLQVLYDQTAAMNDEDKEQKLKDIQSAIDSQKEYGNQQLEVLRQQHEEELAEAQNDYNEKVKDKQSQLDEDTAMLQKHLDEIKDIQDTADLDEIDQLKKQHAEKLAELNAELEKEKNATSGATSAMTGDYQKMFDDIQALANQGVDMNWDNMLQYGEFSSTVNAIVKYAVQAFTVALPTMIKSLFGNSEATINTYVDNTLKKIKTDVNAEKLKEITSNLGTNSSSNSSGSGIVTNIADKYLGTQFASGINYVPNDMVAKIHEGEAVVPKQYNPYNPDADKASGVTNLNFYGDVYGIDDFKRTVENMIKEGQARSNRLAKFNINIG